MIAKFLNYHLFILSIGWKNKTNLSQENPLYISTDKKIQLYSPGRKIFQNHHMDYGKIMY